MNRSIRNTLLAVALLGCGTLAAHAQQDSIIYRPWSEMYSSVGKEMGFILSTGAYVRGKATSIRRDEVSLKIKTTSDPAAYPKKETLVPISAIEEVQLYERFHRRDSRDAEDVGDATRHTGIALGGIIGWSHGRLPGMVIGGALGNLAGVLGSVAIRRRTGNVEEEVIRIHIVPEANESVTIPKEVRESSDALLRERRRALLDGGTGIGARTRQPSLLTSGTPDILGGSPETGVEGSVLLPGRSGGFRNDGPAIPESLTF